MHLLIYLFLLLLGLTLLWKGGEYCVKYSVEFSLLYHIESFTIGFFLFSVTTGLPEISSALVSSIKKVPQLSSGDLIGSAFFNLTFVLSLVILLVRKIEIEKLLLRRILLTTGLIFVIIIVTAFFSIYSMFLGMGLIALYFLSLFFFRNPYQKKSYQAEKKEAKKDVEKLEKKAFFSAKIDVFLKLIVSLLVLILGSWLTINASIQVARDLHFDLAAMGGTFIAIGTGLPELSLELNAVRKKQYYLALGDIFGSSLLNVSFILGLLLTFNPGLSLGFAKIILPLFLFVLIYILLRAVFTKKFQNIDGYILLTSFVVYLVYVLLIEMDFIGLRIDSMKIF